MFPKTLPRIDRERICVCVCVCVCVCMCVCVSVFMRGKLCHLSNGGTLHSQELFLQNS